MSRLDEYRIALLAAHTGVDNEMLASELGVQGDDFASFIIAHGMDYAMIKGGGNRLFLYDNPAPKGPPGH